MKFVSNYKIILIILLIVSIVILFLLFRNSKSEIKRDCANESQICIVLYENNNLFGNVLNLGNFETQEVRLESSIDKNFYQSITLPKYCQNSFGFNCLVYEDLNSEKVNFSIDDENKLIEITTSSPFGRNYQEYKYTTSISYK